MTKKERAAKYYLDHKESISIKNKIYSEKNKVKVSERSQLHYLNNKEKSKLQTNKNREQRKERLVTSFDNVCAVCRGSFHPSAYDFHHLNPKEKEIEISNITNNKVRLEEIKKCIMLCANCHRTIHARLDYVLVS